ncbi:MAG: hypothetical protein K9N06_02040 [Candidatus Cloacimonetes bacterium]|nr:hypothetical protein [Candidatus Cloacimonadota bacterium]
MIFLTREDIECKYIDINNPDLSEDIILNSVIAPGELLIEKALVNNNIGKRFYIAEKISDGKTILFKLEHSPKNHSYCILPYSFPNNLISEMNAIELLITLYYNITRKPFDRITDDLRKQVMIIKDDLKENDTYKIYVRPESKEEGYFYKPKGIILKELLSCEDGTNYPKYSEPDIFQLRESIALNEDIPYELRRNIIGDYIRFFLKRDKQNKATKEKYFDFLFKLVVDYAFKPFSSWKVPEIELDQHAVVAALMEYTDGDNIRDNITADDLIDFYDRVIATSQNPKTILRAYAAKTYACLELKDTGMAKEIAAEALELYDEPYTQEYDAGILNGLSAIFYLRYLMSNDIDPDTIYAEIEYFNDIGSGLPEFQNHLVFIKAILTDLTANSVEDVIEAYSHVKPGTIEKSNSNDYCNYASGLTRVDKAEAAIKTLNNQVRDNIILSKPFSAKKYLLANEELTMNESGLMDVTIIQHEIPSAARTIAQHDNTSWKKAEINGEIFWIDFDYSEQYTSKPLSSALPVSSTHTQIPAPVKSQTELNHDPGKFKPRIIEARTPQIFFTLKDIECKYITPNKLDFSQDIILDSIIATGEILLETSEVRDYPEADFYIAQMKTTGEFVLFLENKCRKYYPYIATEGAELSGYFNDFNEIELAHSMFFSHLDDFGTSLGGSDILFRDVLQILTDNIDNEQVYKIYLKTDKRESGCLFELDGINLKALMNISNIRNKKGLYEEEEYTLRESIAWNDAIPFEFKSHILVDYIRTYFDYHDAAEPEIQKYLEVLINIVTNYSHKKCSRSGGGKAIDLSAVFMQKMNIIIRTFP